MKDYENERELTQAERIIKKYGGVKNLAQALGLSKSTIYRWTYSKEDGGTGGTIPIANWQGIKETARQYGVILEPMDMDIRPALLLDEQRKRWKLLMS